MPDPTPGLPALLFLSTSYWASPMQFRRHHFARLAAERGGHVVFVNPTFTVLSFVLEPNCRRVFFDFFRGPREVAPRLHVVTMPPLLPFQRKLYLVNVLNNVLTGLLLDLVLRRHFGDRRFVHVAYQPEDHFRPLLRSRALLVYDCIDQHTEYPWNRRIQGRIGALEERLLAEADVVTVTSSHLLERKKAKCKTIRPVPNGVDIGLFGRARGSELDVAPELAHVKGPVVMYVGAIAEWFDVELVEHIAIRHPEWTLVLIGPQSVRAPGLTRTTVLRLGTRDHADLPRYLKRADVCLIPFVVNELTLGVNPLKLYEYLAAGKPVVSTALPDVCALEQPQVVCIGRNHEEFLRHVEDCIGSTDEWIDARVKLAEQFSWESVFGRFIDAIEQARA